jgi:hypothetical protein
VQLLTGVADGLAAAHGAGILHRGAFLGSDPGDQEPTTIALMFLASRSCLWFPATTSWCRERQHSVIDDLSRGVHFDYV